MGVFSKIKGALSSKANAALDKAIDPAKELDMKIMELEDGKRKALQELVSYKASVKTMEQELGRLDERRTKLEARAMQAVKAGDDDLARRCLKDKKEADLEAARVRRDRDEVNGYAVQLNKSRKELEVKLTTLKLKKGTLATQLAAARSGSGNPLGVDDSLFDKLAAAEDRIDSDAIQAEVDAALEGGSLADATELDGKLLAAEASHGGDDALAALKAKMQAGGDKKLLKK